MFDGRGWSTGLANLGRSIVVMFLALLLGTAASRAAELSVHAGRFDTEQSLSDGPVDVGIEVRLDSVELWHPSWAVLIPAFGILGTEDGVFYGYGGFRLQVPLGKSWRITPHVAAGFYDEGDGKDLGGPVEFRSGLEVAYRVGEKMLLGVDFYHLSNAVIYDFNPGVNSLVVGVSFGL